MTAAQPPICQNLQSVPARKYLTSTGKGHRFIASVPQEFDCRVPTNIKKGLKDVDVEIRNDQHKASYKQVYIWKTALPEQFFYRPPTYKEMQYLRPVQENLQKHGPLIATDITISEMKDNFRSKYATDVEPIPMVAPCYIYRLGNEQQPGIPIEKKGFWRWLDPYVSTSRMDYNGYTTNSNLKEKTLTFYNVAEFDLPARSGNKTLFDRVVFKYVPPVNMLSNAQKRVPNFGMQTEYNDKYVKQTFSTVYPFLDTSCTEFEDSIPPASSYQNLCAPGMYCSEYCTIGHGDVRRIIETGPEKRKVVRSECCPKI